MAKTVAAVAEAAAAQGTNQPGPASAGKSLASSRPAARTTAAAGEVFPGRRVTPSVLATRALHLKRSVWGPLAVFSGALWLRVTGTFFALIASTMGAAAWRQRRDLHTPAGSLSAHHFWLFAAFTLLFGYFAVSSFVRARLKEHRALTR